MNTHTKIAIFIAPFLLIGGYIASDQYLEYKANQPKIFKLQTVGSCDILNQGCLQQSGDMQLKITDENGVTKVNTSFPVDSVAISLVYPNGDETIYGLEAPKNPQFWERTTDIRSALSDSNSTQTLRLMVKMKGHTYLNEFTNSTP